MKTLSRSTQAYVHMSIVVGPPWYHFDPIHHGHIDDSGNIVSKIYPCVVLVCKNP